MTTTFPFPGTFPTNFGSFGSPNFGYPNFNYSNGFGFNPSWNSGFSGFGTPSSTFPFGSPSFGYNSGNSFGSWQNSNPWNFGGSPSFNAYTFGGTPTGFTWNPWTGWTPAWTNSFSPTGYAFPNFSGYGNSYGTPGFNYTAPTYGTPNFSTGSPSFSTQNRPYPTYPSYADRTGCCNPARDAA